MSDLATKKMLDVYIQGKAPSRYFTRKFKSVFFESESVEIDVVRSEEEVAIVIANVATGSRMNSGDIYTNKLFVPPIYDEGVVLNVYDLLKRSAGEHPFSDVGFQRSATARMLQNLTKAEDKIRRAVELQASMVLQTGILSLIDSGGNVLYTIDYKPKATHFPTSAPIWNAAGDDKLGDLKALANVVREDGLMKPDVLTFGEDAFQAFIQDAVVQGLLDNRRMTLGDVSPVDRGEEATFQGRISIGDYKFEMFTVNSRFTHPQTGVSTPYMDPAKVIVESSMGRKDGAWGAIPMIVAPDQRALPFLPERISNAVGGVDLFPNAWVSNDGKRLLASVAARPIMIPVGIDTFGCLDTGL